VAAPAEEKAAAIDISEPAGELQEAPAVSWPTRPNGHASASGTAAVAAACPQHSDSGPSLAPSLAAVTEFSDPTCIAREDLAQGTVRLKR
jgi:hypothetical protein